MSRDECMSSSATSFMLSIDCRNENGLKPSAVGLEEGVGLSTGRWCSLNRCLSCLFFSPI